MCPTNLTPRRKAVDGHACTQEISGPPRLAGVPVPASEILPFFTLLTTSPALCCPLQGTVSGSPGQGDGPCSLTWTPQEGSERVIVLHAAPTDPVQSLKRARRKISLRPDHVNKRARPRCPPMPGNGGGFSIFLSPEWPATFFS